MKKLIRIYYCQSASSLSEKALALLMRAQVEIIRSGGVLGLFEELSFVIAIELDPSEIAGNPVVSNNPVGILAIRPDDDDGIWIQLAYTDPDFRRLGVFRDMVEWISNREPEKKFGLATKITNYGMTRAAESCGFEQKIRYFYRDRQRAI